MSIDKSSRGQFKEEIKDIAEKIAVLANDIKYGSIELVIHDGRIVQIDKRERFRLNEPKN